jgi:FkbH-like protein
MNSLANVSKSRLAVLHARLSVATEPALTDIFVQGAKLLLAGRDGGEGADGALRIAIVGTMTTEFVARALAIACVQENVFPLIEQAPYGAFHQEILDPNSNLYRFKPQIVVLVIGWRDCVTELPLNADAEAARAAIGKRVDELDKLWRTLQSRTAARIIQHLVAPPPFRLTGVGERSLPGSPIQQVAAFNQEVCMRGSGRILFLDLARLSQERGALAMLEPRGWFATKAPFETSFLPSYVPALRGVLRNATARAKKALVLDLDNTLWGGVIGDDGVEGLRLGPGDALGEAYADFQSYVAQLGARGVILAVCSKNSPKVAETGFTHPASVLQRKDFAAFECSWNDKVGGLRRIAATLNIGLDSLVFVDDNPAECDLVRKELPEVATVHLGDEPSDFIRRLEEGYWFELQNFTMDDLGRANAYQARAAVAMEREQAADLESYLTGLDMKGAIFAPSGAEIQRVAQLEQKTNQFNLLTKRYDEATIRSFLARTDHVVWAASLADKHGDHGLVSVLIGEIRNDALNVQEWLMSCRVFSRTLEQGIMRELITYSKKRGIEKIVGSYRQTAKNGVVADLYPRLGFGAVGEAVWERDTSASLDDLVTYIAIFNTAMADPAKVG